MDGFTAFSSAILRQTKSSHKQISTKKRFRSRDHQDMTYDSKVSFSLVYLLKTSRNFKLITFVKTQIRLTIEASSIMRGISQKLTANIIKFISFELLLFFLSVSCLSICWQSYSHITFSQLLSFHSLLTLSPFLPPSCSFSPFLFLTLTFRHLRCHHPRHQTL